MSGHADCIRVFAQVPDRSACPSLLDQCRRGLRETAGSFAGLAGNDERAESAVLKCGNMFRGNLIDANARTGKEVDAPQIDGCVAQRVAVDKVEVPVPVEVAELALHEMIAGWREGRNGRYRQTLF